MSLPQDCPLAVMLVYADGMGKRKSLLADKQGFDSLLVKMLNTPPLPMKEAKAKKKRAPKRKEPTG